MSEVTNKSEKKETKLSKQLIVGAVIAAILFIVIIVVIILSGNKKPAGKDKDQKKPVEEVEIKTYTEQELVEAYNFSIKDAEELVMSIYHSDNFECSTTIEEAHYVVTVTDVLSGDKTVYTVNPASHEYTRDK